MNKKDFALTQKNLIYMDLYEPFNNCYNKYINILSDSIDIISSKNDDTNHKRIIWPSEILQQSKKDIRNLFNEFLNDYLYVFTDIVSCLHVNKIFLNYLDIFEMKRKRNDHFNIVFNFSSFSTYLYYLQLGVAFLIKNNLQKRLSIKIDDETILKDMNERIIELASKGKSKQIVTKPQENLICREIYIYDSLKSIKCNQEYHPISSSFCICKSIKGTFVRLPVHYCSRCLKNFIGRQSLLLYEKEYGDFFVKRFFTGNDSEIDYYSFSQSLLYTTGYNVKENGMSETERHTLLKYLIDTKQLSFFEIIRDLENAIRWHTKYTDRFAVEKWKQDLQYVNSLIDHNKI